MTEIEKKVWPEYFQKILDGTKIWITNNFI